MTPWIETRRHPLDVVQNIPPVEAHERLFYEAPEVTLPYRGLVWLAVLLACGVVWFAGTVMVIKFWVAG